MQLTSINCFNGHKLGPVHQHEHCTIFLPEDTYPESSIEGVSALFRQLFKIPESLAQVVLKYEALLQTDVK